MSFHFYSIPTTLALLISSYLTHSLTHSLTVQDIVYRGGPAAYLDDKDAHFETLTSSSSIVRIISSHQQQTFRVVCAGLGEAILTLRVGNKATLSNQSPRVESINVPFTCAHPSSISAWMARADDSHMKVGSVCVCVCVCVSVCVCISISHSAHCFQHIITNECTTLLLEGKQPYPVCMFAWFLFIFILLVFVHFLSLVSHSLRPATTIQTGDSRQQLYRHIRITR